MKAIRRLAIAITICALCCIAVLGALPASVLAASPDQTTAQTYVLARPSTSGTLHLEGSNLVDKDGNPVQLKGVSTHGLTWFPDFVNQGLFTQVSQEWDANLIRLAAYSQEFSNGNKQQSMELVRKGIEYAIQADTYVIVDWHVLEDKDPNASIEQAMEFFYEISREYANVPNVIYEICNEPNGSTTWADVKDYAQTIIPLIKSQDPNAIIVVGTPDYDRDLAAAVDDPISGYSNIMYAFHFYAASHQDDMLGVLQDAVGAGLPVFVTECGMSEEDGDGTPDYAYAQKWFSYLQEHGLPFTIWSLSNKDEASAMVKSTVYKPTHLEDGDLTTYGKAVKAVLKGEDISAMPVIDTAFTLENLLDRCREHWGLTWAALFGSMALIVIITLLLSRLVRSRKSNRTYDDYLDPEEPASTRDRRLRAAGKAFLLISTVCSLAYLLWRVLFSVPVGYGAIAIFFNLLLLVVEVIGFAQSSIHYSAMLKLRDHPLPQAADDEFPHVDVFISTYNEPEDLLRKTILGCKHMKYPDISKVHIYVCDDNRRPTMRALAQELGVNYFDRPDNQGAKAGNLNHAMGLTSSPYIVTFDADMIPREDFLLRTIPYYIDAEKKGIPLGLVQTPQCFYTEDIFQHNLYAEDNVPNEQDFFYRTIEPARTATNSVIYGGSNTILARKALESIGGFYTECITEDFATGMLMESHGYVSLGLSEPLASGLAPSSFQEHLQQRTRWGRGVILTAKKLKFMREKGLTFDQKISYLSSVVYWFSPLFNAVYLIMPLMFAVFSVPVFRCTVPELAIFWLPMFLTQNICLRLISAGSMSVKWSGIQETCVTPFLLVPILKETLGFSLSVFKVTDKSKKAASGHKRNWRLMAPFIVLSIVYAIGIVRVIYLGITVYSLGLLILFFWLVRNYFFVVMGLFLADGRETDGEAVKVRAPFPVALRQACGTQLEGVTTQLTEHNVKLTLTDGRSLRLGESVSVTLSLEAGSFDIQATVVEVLNSNEPDNPPLYTLEIMDFKGHGDDYLHALYNRIPTLPQSLTKDLGIIGILARNFAKRL